MSPPIRGSRRVNLSCQSGQPSRPKVRTCLMYGRSQGVFASEPLNQLSDHRGVLPRRVDASHKAAVGAGPFEGRAVARRHIDANVMSRVSKDVHGLTTVLNDLQLAL